MSSTLDIWCDNCGKWSSSNPEYAVKSFDNLLPHRWVSITFNTCRLHLCDTCVDGMKKALASITPCVRHAKEWTQRDEHLRIGSSSNLYDAQLPAIHLAKANEETSDISRFCKKIRSKTKTMQRLMKASLRPKKSRIPKKGDI